ncbi:MAG: glycoside hydrolase family 92 protein [Deltaproteobacteria bacterium]|nr:MAG: glycoside hydrolase family 92 protein [Deltaproteobacteria bacterium]
MGWVAPGTIAGKLAAMGRGIFAFSCGLVLLAAACGDPAEPPADGGADAAADAGTDAALDAGPDAVVDAGPPPPSMAAPRPFTQWVDPFIATGGLGFGVGSAYPGPARPFGMVHPGPDTMEEAGLAPGFAHCAGYWYADDHIRGFSHTRAHGMGIPEYGAVMLMPTVGMDASKTGPDGYGSTFSHDTEEAAPGYYAVTLEDPGVRVELTAGERVAVHRYTFDAGADAVVLSDVGHHMADVEAIDGEIVVDPAAQEFYGFSTFSAGYSERFGGMPVYFVMRFSRPFSSHGVWKAGALFDGETTRAGVDSGAWARFDASTDTSVEVAVGISFVDLEHARMNLDAEAPTIDFEGTRAATEAVWEEHLGRAEIEARTEAEFRTFYTALYHTLLMPTLATDVDGAYRGIDQEVHAVDGFTYYTDFSLWDTFRTLHPLLTLLYPEHQLNFLRSLLAMGTDGGYMPRWPLGIGYTGGMVGDGANIVFADSWVKGITDFDLRAAYDIMLRTATMATPPDSPFHGRSGVTEYMELGYVPIEAAGSSASWTLEVAYMDHGLATMAEALGEDADAADFRARSGNWRNLLDPESGFFIGRHADGTFADVDPFIWEDYYSEGNAWHYLWLVPHDLDGLAEALGGRDAFFERLDYFFFQSMRRPYVSFGADIWYWHGNEPDIHAPWIYSALGRPAETARVNRWVVDTRYGDGPDGLPGNDDGGTMSAWYVFTALGIFPLTGLDYYLVGGPQVTGATLHLTGGDLTIEAPNASYRAFYVQDATLDGVSLDRARVDHADLAGSTLHFEMGVAPSDWAAR